MDCWNADLIGPFSTVEEHERLHLTSYSGYNYALVVVDEWSRYVMVRLLKKKSEATQALIDLIRQKRVLTGKPLKRVNTDGGTEILNKEMKDFLREEGIELTTSTPYAVIHNPIVERMNQTLETVARCLLHHASAPEELWSEAITHAADLHNYTCQASIGGELPIHRMEGLALWRGFDINKLHTFGCDAAVVLNEEDRGKFQERTVPGIYLGYSRQYHAHRIMILNTLDVRTQRSVIFKEDSFENLHTARKALQSMAGDHHVAKADRHYEVKCIEDERVKDGAEQLRVRWKRYRIPTWESRTKLLRDCPDIVREYDDRRAQLTMALCCVLQGGDIPSGAGTGATAPRSAVDYVVPKSFNEAMRHPDREQWLLAIASELESIRKHGTGTLVYLPASARALGTQWVFAVKWNEKNEIVRYKARLVVLGKPPSGRTRLLRDVLPHGVDQEPEAPTVGRCPGGPGD